MTISVWGFGGTSISDWGWGTNLGGFIPILLAQYMYDQPAYECILAREYTEIISRDEEDVLPRTRPDIILDRETSTEFGIRGRPSNILVRGRGYVFTREYVEIKSRETGDIVMRIRPSTVLERELSGEAPERMRPSTILVRSPVC